MTKSIQLVQKNFFQYESSRKHVDDMTPGATENCSEAPKVNEAARACAPTEHGKLFSGLDTYQQRRPEQWGEGEFEKIGPMVVWETVAQQLERLLEHLEH